MRSKAIASMVILFLLSGYALAESPKTGKTGTDWFISVFGQSHLGEGSKKGGSKQSRRFTPPEKVPPTPPGVPIPYPNTGMNKVK